MKKTRTIKIFLIYLIVLLFTSRIESQVSAIKTSYYSAQDVFSQNHRFKQLNVEDGLSQKEVYAVYRDSKGLMWFCTQDGLNLYDGYQFKIFRHQPGNENSLPDYAVYTICETDTGIFWIGTREGMSRLDLTTGRMIHYTNNPDSVNSLIDNNIWFITKDSENHLWIATRKGLSRLNPVTNKFDNFHYDPSDANTIRSRFVLAVIEDNKKNIWIGGQGGLDKYNLKSKKFSHFKLHPENPNSVSLNGVMSLLIHNNVLWVGSYSGLYSAGLNDPDNENLEFTHHQFKANQNESSQSSSISHNQYSVRSIAAGKDGVIWVATYGNGLFRYKPETGYLVSYEKQQGWGSLTDNYILSLLEDEFGVLWIGTSSTGINKYNRSSERFRVIRFQGIEVKENTRVSALLEDKSGSLWIGTESGELIQLKNQFSDNRQLRYLNKDRRFSSLSTPTEIRTIMQDRKGNIWVGTFGNGIYLIDPVTLNVKGIRRERGNSNSLSNDFVHTIFETSDGMIWIGTGAGGLNRYDPNNHSFLHYRHDPENPKSVSTMEITAIIEDQEGFIWAGTSTKGLNRLNPRTGEVDRFVHNIYDLKTLSSNRILNLLIDKNSNLWIGTFGGGINRWNPEDSSFTHFTTANGLPSNIINAIAEDNQGTLWLTTDKGLSAFDIEISNFNNFDMNDGLQGNEFSIGAAFVSKLNDNIYIGGTNGLNIFNPLEMNPEKKLSNIVFTDFKIFNKSIVPEESYGIYKNILYADEIILTHDQNFFTFEFASLDFNNSEKNQYSYLLEGFNKDWVYAGNQRTATYTNLNPGEYIFHVKATNSDGIWNEEGISLKVILLPPWWQTWWAYILYALFIVSILYSFRQYEMKRVKLRNDLQLKAFEAEKLQEVDQLKSQFFANISHEFRTPLTLILGLLQKFESSTTNKKAIKDYNIMRRNAVKLLQLINQLLELSKLESGAAKLQASEYDIISFVKMIFVSFASYAEQKKIKLRFNGKDINSEIHTSLNVFFDKDKMEKIISNLISNAVKYTPEGNEIEVRILSDDNFAYISIVNTGITISGTDIGHLFDRYYKVHRAEEGMFEGTGIGLALVKELIELHKGQISVSSEYDITEFTVKLPIGKSHLKPHEITYDKSDLFDESVKISETDLAEELSLEHFFEESNSDRDIILVVEDHIDLRKFIKDNLSEI